MAERREAGYRSSLERIGAARRRPVAEIGCSSSAVVARAGDRLHRRPLPCRQRRPRTSSSAPARTSSRAPGSRSSSASSSIVLATILAVLGALGRLSRTRSSTGSRRFYVSLVRGTPLLVQIFFIYFALPQLGIMLPAIPAGILALGFNYGAYMTEIFRAGIQAVPRGQREAAEALGMPERLVFRRIVLPQAVRIVTPPIGNEFIAMIKDSALCLRHRRAGAALARAAHSAAATSRSLEALAGRGAAVYWGLTIIFSLLPGSSSRSAWREATDDRPDELPDLGERPATTASATTRVDAARAHRRGDRARDRNPQVLRREPRPARRRPGGPAARGGDGHRSIRERQDDPAALPQLPRGADRRDRSGSTAWRWRPIR